MQSLLGLTVLIKMSFLYTQSPFSTGDVDKYRLPQMKDDLNLEYDSFI